MPGPTTLFLDMPAWVFLKRISAFDSVDCVKKFTLSNRLTSFHHLGHEWSKNLKLANSPWAELSIFSAFRHRSSWILGFQTPVLNTSDPIPRPFASDWIIPRAFLVFQLLFSLKIATFKNCCVCEHDQIYILRKIYYLTWLLAFFIPIQHFSLYYISFQRLLIA